MKEVFCKTCDKEIPNAKTNIKYCPECKKEALKRNQEKCYKNKKEKSDIESNKKYEDNFISVTGEPYTYTTFGFNEVSKISVKSYSAFYNCKWLDVIKRYDKYKELYDYVASEFAIFVTTGSQDVNKFCKNHKYITYDLLNDIGMDSIYKFAGVRKLSYSDKDYKDNFRDLCKIFGRIPLFTEFDEHSNIGLPSYVYKYSLKGKQYQNLVKMFAETEEEIAAYNVLQKIHKSNVGKITGPMSATYTLDDYETEFKRVFDECIQRFGVNPPRRLFDKISKFDSSSYRRRLDKAWLDICELYGYKIDKWANQSEKIVLDSISEIIGHTYKPQKTWEWLIGNGGKHMYCDGYYEQLNLVIEFDGKQHRKPIKAFGGTVAYERLVKNDQLKTNLLKEQNIQLIRIDSREPWHDINFLTKKLIDNGIPIKNKYTYTTTNDTS